MDDFIISVIVLVIGILGGGYLGYRYGRSVQQKAEAVKRVL